MRPAYMESITYRQGEDGLWSAVHERLGIGAIAGTKKEAGRRLIKMVIEHLEALSDEEVEAHMASCQKMGIDENNQLVPWPNEPEAAAG